MDDGEVDVLADQAAQQVRQLGQHVGDVEHPRLQALLAREGEQLAHQVGGAVGVLLDLHDVGEGLVARPVAQQQEVAEADHRRQQVVEVVGDAAGELAHRLDLLRMGELQLEPLLLGGVDQEGAQAGRLAAGLVAPRGRQDGDAPGAAGELDIERRRRRGVGGGARQLVVGGGAVDGMDQLGERAAFDDRRQDAFGHGAEGAVALLDAAGGIEQHDAERRLVDEAAQPLLRLLQRRLGIAHLVALLDDAADMEPEAVAANLLAEEDLERGAVAAAQLDLGRRVVGVAADQVVGRPPGRRRPGKEVGQRRRSGARPAGPATRPAPRWPSAACSAGRRRRRRTAPRRSRRRAPRRARRGQRAPAATAGRSAHPAPRRSRGARHPLRVRRPWPHYAARSGGARPAGRGDRFDPGGQSSRWVRSMRSWRSCASMLRVAIGRASRRRRLIGSLVSSQKP